MELEAGSRTSVQRFCKNSEVHLRMQLRVMPQIAMPCYGKTAGGGEGGHDNENRTAKLHYPTTVSHPHLLRAPKTSWPSSAKE